MCLKQIHPTEDPTGRSANKVGVANDADKGPI